MKAKAVTRSEDASPGGGRIWWYVALVVVGLLAPVVLSTPGPTQAATVSAERAVVAAELMKDWAVWLTGIAVGAIGALGLLLQNARSNARRCGLVAVTFFGASLLMNSWLAAGLPSVVVRVQAQPTTHNDIYEMQLFGTTQLERFVPYIRVGYVYVIAHSYFVFGVLSFAVAFWIHPPVQREPSE